MHWSVQWSDNVSNVLVFIENAIKIAGVGGGRRPLSRGSKGVA